MSGCVICMFSMSVKVGAPVYTCKVQKTVPGIFLYPFLPFPLGHALFLNLRLEPSWQDWKPASSNDSFLSVHSTGRVYKYAQDAWRVM